MPIYRDLWGHLKANGHSLPKKGAAKSGDLDPESLPAPIQTALNALYDHYLQVDREWAKRADRGSAGLHRGLQ